MNSTIFNYVDSILFDKQHLDDVKYDESQYGNYMVNRWCSMCTTDSAEIINETTNKYWSVMTQRQDHYEFLLNLMPTQRRKRLSYIKKIKEDVDKKTDDNIQHIARNMELSTREIKMMMS
jgi:hypothetical protein